MGAGSYSSGVSPEYRRRGGGITGGVLPSRGSRPELYDPAPWNADEITPMPNAFQALKRRASDGEIGKLFRQRSFGAKERRIRPHISTSLSLLRLGI